MDHRILDKIQNTYDKGGYISLIELDMINVLGLKGARIRQAIKDGHLKAFKADPTKQTGKWLVDKSAVEAYKKYLTRNRPKNVRGKLPW